MKIKVLGAGCSKCHQLEQTVRQVVKELDIDAAIEEVKDIKKIMGYPILAMPGLVINEEVVCSGCVPGKSDVTRFIINALDKEEKSKDS